MFVFDFGLDFGLELVGFVGNCDLGWFGMSVSTYFGFAYVLLCCVVADYSCVFPDLGVAD